MQSDLLLFFLNEDIAHPDGYTPREIVNHWTDDDLEGIHNWVQWCFPLVEGSRYQPDTPTLTPKIINSIRTSKVAQKSLDDLTYRVIDFYDRRFNWLVPTDHNHLRITRIIKSLGLLAPPGKGLMFYHLIMWKVTCYSRPCIVNASSVALWKEAADAIRYPGSATVATILGTLPVPHKTVTIGTPASASPAHPLVYRSADVGMDDAHKTASEILAEQAAKQEGQL